MLESGKREGRTGDELDGLVAQLSQLTCVKRGYDGDFVGRVFCLGIGGFRCGIWGGLIDIGH